MMYGELRRAVADAAAGVERRKHIDSVCRATWDEVRELESRVFALKRSKEKETGDVEKLERVSAASVISSLLGTKADRLDKEKREAAAARLKYDAAVSELSDCRERAEAMEDERRSLKNADAEYAAALNALREAVRSDPRFTERLEELERKLAAAKAQIRETGEAISAGSAALREAEAVERSLSSAEGWGTWDLIGGGLVSSVVKHSHLDDAQAGAQRLQRQLDRFRTELADVNAAALAPVLEHDGFLRFADWFFDGLIVDWAVLSRIHKSQESLYGVKRSLSTAVSRLEALKSALADSQRSLEKQISDILGEAAGQA